MNYKDLDFAPKPWIDLKSIGLGVAAFMAIRFFFLVAGILVSLAHFAANRAPVEDLESAGQVPWLNHVLNLLGSPVAAFVAGFLAAWLAQRDSLRHGTVAGGLALVVALIFSLAGERSLVDLIVFGLIVPCAALGGLAHAKWTGAKLQF